MDKVSFGREQVEPAEKTRRVRGVFSSVAARYDLMNDLMSGGVHRLWKEHLVDWLAPRPGIELLDVAGGTGDIALRVLDRLEPGTGHVIVCDLTAEMLAVGRDRAIDRGVVTGLAWVCGAAFVVLLVMLFQGDSPALIAILTPANLFTGVLASGIIALPIQRHNRFVCEHFPAFTLMRPRQPVLDCERCVEQQHPLLRPRL